MLSGLWSAFKRSIPLIGLITLAGGIGAVCGTALVPAGRSSFLVIVLICGVVILGAWLRAWMPKRRGWTIAAALIGVVFAISSMLSAGPTVLQVHGKTTDAQVIAQDFIPGIKSDNPTYVYTLVDESSKPLTGKIALQADKPPLHIGDNVRVVYDPAGWALPMREVDYMENVGSWAGVLFFGLLAAVLSVLASRPGLGWDP